MQGWGAGVKYTGEEIDDTGDGIVGLQNQALWILFLFMGIAPILLFALVIVWEKHWNKQRQESAEQDVNPSKVVEPLREGHLVDLMKNFTMILSKSHICDENCHLVGDLVEEMLSPGTFGDTKMEIPKAERKKDDAGGWNSIDCDDNSQCQHSSFCIPLAGQRLAKGEGEMTQLPRRIESDGCAICMNPLDVGQKVVWSSNPECSHVFHHQCLLDWFLAVGAKKWKVQAARHIEMDPVSLEQEISKFPKLCPICRRDYFLVEASEEATTDNESDDDSRNRPNQVNGTNEEPPISINSFDYEESDIEQGSGS